MCVYSCCLLPWILRPVLFLFPVPDICFLLFGPVFLTVVLLICYLSICTPPPLAFSLVCELLFVNCYMFIWLSSIDSVSCAGLLLSLPNVLYLMLSDYLASDFCIDNDFCFVQIKSLFYVTPLCIWVLSTHLHFTIRNNITCRLLEDSNL